VKFLNHFLLKNIMNTLEQWGIILVIFLIFTIFGSDILSKIRKKLNDPDWNNIFVGIIVGGLIVWGITWHRDKNRKPDDWCAYLPEEKSSYCVDLYWQSVDYQEKFYKEYGDPYEGENDDYGFR